MTTPLYRNTANADDAVDAGANAPDKPYNRVQILWLRFLGLVLARELI